MDPARRRFASKDSSTIPSTEVATGCSLEYGCAVRAASRTFWTAGTSRPMRIAIIAITTKNSRSVNPGELRFPCLIAHLRWNAQDRTKGFMVVPPYWNSGLRYNTDAITPGAQTERPGRGWTGAHRPLFSYLFR